MSKRYLMVYDSLNYAAQVYEARRSYKEKHHNQETDNACELLFEEDQVKIKLTSEEFLSGYRKEDKLIPVITAVIYFGSGEWDGPTSIHEILKVPDKRHLRVIPDYFVNLIAPANIEESEFDKFHTDLGFAMKVIKHQKDSAVEIIRGTNHKKIDRVTAEYVKALLTPKAV